MTTDLRVAAVWRALAGVLDPCSVHNGTRLSFVDLGMVEAVHIDDRGEAQIQLLLDDPVCIYLVDILTSVRDAALAVDGVNAVDVHIIGDELWSPDRLTPETQRKMRDWEAARQGRRQLSLTPVR